MRVQVPQWALNGGINMYVVLDLEMCVVPKRLRNSEHNFAHEIIQIGAVLLNKNLDIQDEYNTLVHPELGIVDEYIERLTGITGESLNGAPNLECALTKFVEWIPEEAVMVSWSNNDRQQILREVKAKGLSINRLDNLLNNWIDCQKTFSKKMNCDKCYNLTEALIITDINYKDGAHDGLVDAYNTAILFAKMEREPELVFSKYYKDEADQCGFKLEGLLSNLKLA